MRSMSAASFLVVACIAASLSQSLADTSTTTDLLWPLPSKYAFSSGYYTLDPTTFAFVPIGFGEQSDILQGALERYVDLIFTTPPSSYAAKETGPYLGELASVSLDVTTANDTLGPDTNETYSFHTSNGKGEVVGSTVYGVLRGMETFSQLVYRRSDGSYGITEVSITDTPRFKYRGTMIDTARHYLSPSIIFTHLDAMAYAKFNVLHWHITDDQSFPFQSESLPQLSDKGAYSPTHVYTHEMIKSVIQQAKMRGIRVIVEFDSPGHTRSWGDGEPKVLTQCYRDGQPDGFGPLNPISQYTWEVVDTLFSEVTQLFPDPYLHIGGDEVSYTCWESNPDIQQWMKEKNYTEYSKLQQYYETLLLQAVSALGKTSIVWQEVFDHGLKVVPGTLIDVWKGGWENEMKKVTGSGLEALLSNCWYLNYISYGEDWTKYYKCDPQNFGGTPEEQKLVIGGHASLWGEFVDSTNFLSRYWPRAAVVAERLWSPGSVNSTEAATPRLHNFRCRLISRGIEAEPVEGPSYCATEWTG